MRIAKQRVDKPDALIENNKTLGEEFLHGARFILFPCNRVKVLRAKVKVHTSSVGNAGHGRPPSSNRPVRPLRGIEVLSDDEIIDY